MLYNKISCYLVLPSIVILLTNQSAGANGDHLLYGVQYNVKFSTLRDIFIGRGADIGLYTEYRTSGFYNGNPDFGDFSIRAELGVRNFGNWDDSPVEIGSVIKTQTAIYQNVIFGTTLETDFYRGGDFNLYNGRLDFSATARGTISGNPFTLGYGIGYGFEEGRFTASASGDLVVDDGLELGFGLDDIFGSNSEYRSRVGFRNLLPNGELGLDSNLEWDINTDGLSEIRASVSGLLRGLTPREAVEHYLGLDFEETNRRLLAIGRRLGTDIITREDLDRIGYSQIKLGLQLTYEPQVIDEDKYNVRPNIRLNKSIAQVPETSTVLSLLALGTLGAASTLKRQLKPSQSIEKETTKAS
jgi:hypothetical protein